MPDVILVIEPSIRPDCAQLVLTDATPSGVGTTGYDQTSGLQLADITTVTLDLTVYHTDQTSTTYDQIQLFPTAFYPTPFTADSVFYLFMDSFGGMSGDAFPEGVASMVYTVNGTVAAAPVTYLVNCQQLWSCSTKCCLDAKLAEIADCANCGDKNKDLLKQYLNLQAACSAAECGKRQKSLELLGSVQKFCEENPCPEC